LPRKDQKFERARREMKRQQLTRMAQLDAMEKRLRARIQAKRSGQQVAPTGSEGQA
jgi:hypothetical protein